MRRRDALVAAGIAWAGLVLGHSLTYLLAYPSASARRTHLLATGHAWLGPAALSVGAAIPALLVVAAARAVRTGAAARGRLLPWLALAQVGAFLIVEVVERGPDLGAALADPAVLLGVVVQVAVAAAAWLVVWAVTSVVVAAVRHPAHRRRARARGPRPTAGRLAAPRLIFLVRTRRRAPPSPLPA